MIDERIAARRASVRDAHRRARLARTVWVLVALLVIAALVLVERSALVALEEIEVTGTERLEAEEVREASGLELGTSTLRLQLGQVAARIEAALPLVLTADARRLDPLSVVLEVVEREPVLLVEGDDLRLLLDRDGVLIDALAEEESAPASLPVVSLPGAPPEVGARASEDPTLENALAAWRGLSGPLRAEVVRYRAAGPDELTLVLASGIEVRFGRAVRVDEKVRALGAILEDLGDTPVDLVDVRAPSAPVVVAP